MKKLEFLVGESSGKGKMYPPGQQAMAWTSQDRGAWVMGGQYLRNESKVTYAGMPTMEALMMMTYDTKAKVYRCWVFTPMSSTPIESEGNFEGAKLVFLTKPFDEGTGPTVARITLDPKSKAEVGYVMEMKAGEKWQKVEDGVYTTKKK